MTDYRQMQRLVIIIILIVINLSLGFVIELAPKVGKMIGLTKQERGAHHPCSKLQDRWVRAFEKV